MSHDILAPFFTSLQNLPSVNLRRAQLIKKLLGLTETGVEVRILDFLFFFPESSVDRRLSPALNQLCTGKMVTVQVTIGDHVPPRIKRQPYRVHCHDNVGCVDLIFFGVSRTYLKRLLPSGETRFISGRVAEFNGSFQISHPDYIVESLTDLPLVEPVYPLTAGLKNPTLIGLYKEALACLPTLPEWQDKELLRKKNWPDINLALQIIHRPETPEDILPSSAARQRLAYDEFLANQLTHIRMNHRTGRSFKITGQITEAIYASLPFPLTGSQKRAINEIKADLTASSRMVRLLQGDVGSGKTIVAFLAMAMVVEADCQAAMMVPTDLLAQQHFRTLAPFCKQNGINCALLTGRQKHGERKQILKELASGTIHIIIGTHALFQEDVSFSDLGLAVVDEEHRFGVHQRSALREKGQYAADLLIMTATPIPRTLMLSHFSYMKSSRLTEKPAGHKPVDTRIIPLEQIDKVILRLRHAIERGMKAYWVCPLVKESVKSDITSTETRYKSLRSSLGSCVGFAHGRMSGKEKVMNDFIKGALSVLVTTTIIEVGIDVPEATIIVIEHAERFGLAQLHQLRGRVGRSDAQSTCLLLYKIPIDEIPARRLRILRESNDGFYIAEEDLRLRGAGDLLGIRQSGTSGFRLVCPDTHGELQQLADGDARKQIDLDPDFSGSRGQRLRLLFRLFEREGSVRIKTTKRT
ncbi:MAG: ATP-dependent DNA helicase RecG [Alphaproteobacteria bacterium]|nr:ATP-dependent DNA helicase RecG [Alphaproteobacteria bacterium]